MMDRGGPLPEETRGGHCGKKESFRDLICIDYDIGMYLLSP